MESSVVIKVKYGDTLRRFNAQIINQKLQLNMNSLREKIIYLFNFAPDAELVLTYVDEDSDVVTLVDDDDLRDIVKQALNPWRITVRLKNEKSAKPSARSSGTSTPSRSPRAQDPLHGLNSSASEMLKSVPEPIRETLLKLSTDLAAKATSSSPVFTELVDCFSKMGLSYLNQFAEGQIGIESNILEASRNTTCVTDSKDPHGSVTDSSTTEDMLSTKYQDSSSRTIEKPSPKNGETLEKTYVKTSTAQATVPALPSFIAGQCATTHTPLTAVPAPPSMKFDGLAWPPPPFGIAPSLENKESSRDHNNLPGQNCLKLGPSKISSSDSPHFFSKPATDSTSSLRKMNKVRLGSSSSANYNVSDCPFSGVPLEENTDPLSNRAFDVPLKKSHNPNGGTGLVIHRGVRCDCCGLYPITGTRFKSKVKEDYDLCALCFSVSGKDPDYIRIDHPISSRHPWPSTGLYDPMTRMRPTVPPPFRGCGVKSGRSKLESRFVQDVNILDGTIMAPSTPFTKIWRMRNNGSVVWPQGTQLMWIGGDGLNNTFSVELEIPAAGLLVDEELDIAVDFVAPKLPGRYVSYWRMASPSGQKFGQRVWVLIQVRAPTKENESFRGFNLNLPPANNGINNPDIINVNQEPMVESSLIQPDSSNIIMEPTEPAIDANPTKDQETRFPITDSLLVGDSGIVNPLSPSPTSPVSYPIIDLPEEAPNALPSAPSPVMDVQPSAQEVEEKNDVEATLLRELEEMGFKQVDLNKEVLRMNDYNLEQSVDHLCGVSEWDPILEELQEMGFCDKEMNKKLLKKNNGSIKRVVMDLIAGEKI